MTCLSTEVHVDLAGVQQTGQASPGIRITCHFVIEVVGQSWNDVNCTKPSSSEASR